MVSALETRRRALMFQPHRATATGAVASFRTDVVSALPMEFDLVPIQDLHGQANPYPPGGGVNIWDEEWEVGYWKDDGTAGNHSNRIRCKNRIPFDTDKTYYINASTNNYELYMLFFNSSEAYLRKQLIRNTTFVPPENTAYGLFYVVGISTYSNDISVNYPSTDTAYHPWENLCPISGHTEINVYNESEYDASATPKRTTTFPTPPGTVYGCHVRDNGDGTGTLTVNKVCIEVTEVVATGTSSTGLKCGSKTLSDNGYGLGAISDRYIVSSGVPSVTNRFRIVNNTTLFIFDERFTDKTTASTILATEKPQFCYDLVTPVTYTLSLDAIQSLIGQNHIWVDNADSVSVEYWGH